MPCYASFYRTLPTDFFPTEILFFFFEKIILKSLNSMLYMIRSIPAVSFLHVVVYMVRHLHRQVSVRYNSLFNLVYTGRLFLCYVLDESIYLFRDVGCILSLLFYF